MTWCNFEKLKWRPERPVNAVICRWHFVRRMTEKHYCGKVDKRRDPGRFKKKQKNKKKQVRPRSKPRQFARVFSSPRRPRANAVCFLLKRDAFHSAGEYKLNLWTKEANEEFFSCTDVRISKVDHTLALREISWVIMSTEKEKPL